MAGGARRFRFRPRHKGVAAVAMGVGAALSITGVALAAAAPVVAGLVGVAIGTAYLVSPTWRIEVVVDDAGLAVTARGVTRIRVAWGDVVKVIASPSTRTCFVDGGDASKSVLVPGDGAPAPYAIEDRTTLYEWIVTRVDRAKLVEVATLETAGAAATDRY